MKDSIRYDNSKGNYYWCTSDADASSVDLLPNRLFGSLWLKRAVLVWQEQLS
jgi:hypothetical protein